MALSDVEKEKDLKRNTPKSMNAVSNERWSDAQKLEAINSWLLLGNMSLVSRILGIPRITLQIWKTTNWWAKAVEEIKLQERIELSNKMKKIVEAAHSVVEDRLINGDVILNQKTGEMVRKPVNMKDAHRVAVDLQNQKQAVDKLYTSEEVGEENTEKLEKLAEKFAEFATKSIEKKLDKKRTVDVLVEDVYEVASDETVADNLLLDNGANSDGKLVQEDETTSSQDRG